MKSLRVIYLFLLQYINLSLGLNGKSYASASI